MAWIRIIDEEHAGGRLEEIYRALAAGDGEEVDNILQIHSLHPAGLEAHVALYEAVMRETPTLPKVDREMIGLVVSVINGCGY